jgi:hypothetical protein
VIGMITADPPTVPWSEPAKGMITGDTPACRGVIMPLAVEVACSRRVLR